MLHFLHVRFARLQKKLNNLLLSVSNFHGSGESETVMTFLTKAVMSSQLISISEDQDVADAEALMKTNKIRHLPVVDNFNELSGIITSTDVAKSANKKNKIKAVMSPRVRIIKRDANVKKIIAQMLKFKISSMLVAHEEDLVGIVTTDDLIQLLYELIDEDENLKKLEVSTLIDNDWDGDDDEDIREVKIGSDLESDPEFYS